MTDYNHDQAANHLPKNPAAVALGRLGGRAGTGASKRRSHAQTRKGGLAGSKAATAAMTPQQRTERARKAVNARWAKARALSEAMPHGLPAGG